jgi:hypothetical protein
MSLPGIFPRRAVRDRNAAGGAPMKGFTAYRREKCRVGSRPLGNLYRGRGDTGQGAL